MRADMGSGTGQTSLGHLQLGRVNLTCPDPGCYSATSKRGAPVPKHIKAFTLVELLVSVAILVVALLAVGKIFKMCSDASSAVIAHADVLERLQTISRAIEADLRSITPGLLIINSWPLPAAGSTLFSDQPTDIDDPTNAVRTAFYDAIPRVRFRSDGLAFLSAGGPNLHQSHWSTPPVSSGQAVIFYGHSWPGNPYAPTSLPAIAATDWVLCRRATLILLFDLAGFIHGQPGITWGDLSPPKLFPVAGNAFLASNEFRFCRVDAVVGEHPTLLKPVIGETLDMLMRKIRKRVDKARAKGWSQWPAGDIFGLGGRSELPAKFNDYRRAGALLADHVGDFIIEWTDGKGSPQNWFGAHRDIDGDGNADVSPAVFLTQIGTQWVDVATAFQAVTSTQLGDPYLAIWNKTTWDSRPKALRITMRLYDANRRLRQSVRLIDSGGTPVTATRYGQEHQVVIPIP